MMWNLLRKWILPASIIFSISLSAQAWDKGIYLTQYMLEKQDKLDYFLKEAKLTGINTFVIDHDYFSSHYAPAIDKVKKAGIKVVSRIVVFTDGGNAQQVRSKEHWEKIYKFVHEAIQAGTDTIQLDYIRYSSRMPANPQHAKDVYQVIKWFKAKINAERKPMEIDIFGEVSYYPSLHIGQDLKMFADSVDGINPMVYPSHFWPYQKYSAEPYKTVNNSLKALVGHFDGKPPFKVHAFIEAANFHYLKKTSNAQKQKYLLEQIRAVEDAQNVSGWYVWSANNVYENLFQVLKNNKIKSTDKPADKMNAPVNTATAKMNAPANMPSVKVNAPTNAPTISTAKVNAPANTNATSTARINAPANTQTNTQKNPQTQINTKTAQKYDTSDIDKMGYPDWIEIFLR